MRQPRNGAAEPRKKLRIRVLFFRRLPRLCPCRPTRTGVTRRSPRRKFPLSITKRTQARKRRPRELHRIRYTSKRMPVVVCLVAAAAVSAALVTLERPTPGSSPRTPGAEQGEGPRLGANAAPAPGPKKPVDEEVQTPEYLLLRFFDFDVEANKQYQYRIFLVLENPNYHLPANVLIDEKLAESPWVGVTGSQPIKGPGGESIDWPTDPKYAKWSLPCTSDRLPGDMRLLGGPVAAARGLQEINGEVRVLKWLEKSGLHGSFFKPNLVRGTILNFQDAPFRTPGAAKPTKEPLLTTDCILVDLVGGESLRSPKDGSCVSPGMILVMDGSGNLVLHDEVAEADEWNKANRQPAKRQPPVPPTPGKRHVTGRPHRVLDESKISPDDLGVPPPKGRGH